MIEIYTDGACLGNPGPGGWAAIIVDGDKKRAVHGGHKNTTNNRMEILAVVEGLNQIPKSEPVSVYSDSQYVINTMTRGWKRNANTDLWARMDAVVSGRKLSWNWVRGHSGHPLNEEVDKLAVKEAKSQANGSSPLEESSASEQKLTHVDDQGTARMVDVGAKADTAREAVARGRIVMQPATLALIESNGFEKGDVLGVARVAGIMGGKKTSELIPLCHPLPLSYIGVEFELDQTESAVEITATARTTGKTGVEMEALTAAGIAALTIYDMCKAVDRGMRIEGIRLVRKSGGKSGDIVLE